MPRLVHVLALALLAPLTASAQQPSAPTPLAPAQPTFAPTQQQPPRPPQPSRPAPTQPTRADQAIPAAAAKTPPPTQESRYAALPSPAVNVRIDLTITDTYGGTPSKKTVTMLIANSGNASIRTNMSRLESNAPVLNIDGSVAVFPGNTIRATLIFNYWPGRPQNAPPSTTPAPGEVNESGTVLLQDGKPLLISQSADPVTDRKVTVEVTATIVK